MADELYHYTNPGLVDPSGVPALAGKQRKSSKAPAAPRTDMLDDAPALPAGEHEVDLSKNGMGVLEHIGAAITVASTTFGLASILQSTTFDSDPEYNVTKDKAAFNGVPEQYHEKIREAQSAEEAQFIRNSILEQDQAKQDLEWEGASGTVATVATALADPINWLGGAGAVSAAARGAALAGGSLRAGIATGAAAGAAEGLLYNEVSAKAYQQEDTAENRIINMGLAAGLGAVGGVFATRARKAMDAPDMLDEAMQGTANEIDAAFTRAATEMQETPAPASLRTLNTDMPEPDQRVTEFREQQLAAERAPATETPEAPVVQNQNMGAAQSQAYAAGATYAPDTAPDNWAQRGFAYVAENGKKLKSAVGKVKTQGAWFTSQTREMLASKSSMLQYFAANFLENPSGALSNKTAAIHKETITNRLDGIVMRDYYDGLTQHIKQARKGKSFPDALTSQLKGEMKRDYDKAIRAELEARGVADDLGQTYTSAAPDHIRKAADKWEEGMEAARKDMQKYGLIDDTFEGRKGYVPLRWNGQKILALSKTQRDSAEALLTESYVKMGVSPKAAPKIAKAVFTRATSKDAQVDANLSGMFDKGSSAQLKEFLDQAGVDTADIDNLINRITTRMDRKDTARLRRRTSVDLNMANSELALMDLVDNDMDSIFTGYSREMGGRTALAAQGVLGPSDWAALRQAILDDARTSGARVDSDNLAKELDGIHDAFLGRARGDGINRNAMRLMEATRLAKMGMMGLTQLTDTANIVGRHGVIAFMKNVPAVAGMMRDARKGIKSPLMEELETLIGPVWDDHLLHRPHIRYDRAGGPDGRIGQIIDKALAQGQHYLGYVSMMNHVTEAQLRMGVTLEVGKLAKMAGTVDLATADPKLVKRMASMGFTEENWSKIADNITRNAEFENGTLTELNLGKWDEGVADEMAFALHRSVNQQIQGTFIGETPSVLHTTTGALLSQFRSFPLVAIEKQMRRQFAIGDMEAYGAVLSALTIGAAVAPVRMALQGRQDEINVESVAAQALQYVPAFSLLPDAAGMGAAAGMLPDSFYLRNWGQEQSQRPSFGNILVPPGIQFAGQAIKAGDVAAKALSPWGEETDISSSDIRALKAVTPFGNTFGMAQLFNALGGADE